MSSTAQSAARAGRGRGPLALTVALGLTVGLSACGGGSVTGSSGGGEGGATTILMWNMATGDSSTKLGEMVEEYNASQDDYVLQSQYIPSDAFTARLVSAVQSDQAPDLVIGDANPSALGEVIDTEAVLPMDDFLDTGDTPVDKADIPQGMLDASTFDGTLYSLPTDGGDYAIIYNKKMFEEAGITEPPQTWEEMAAVAKKLTTDDHYGVYLPIGNNEWPVFTWQSMLWGAGGEFLNEDNTQVAFNSPEGVKALKIWTDMVEEGVAYPSSMADSNQNQGFPGFNAGQYAMFIGGAYNLDAVKEGIGEENVGVFEFPVVDQPAMNTGTNVSYILDGSEAEEKGAWDFLSWFIQPEQQAEWDIATGYLPTNSKTQGTEAYQQFLEENPLVQPFVDSLEYARTRPSVSDYAEVSAALATQLERAMLQKTTPEEALAAAAEQGQKALDAG